MIDAVVSAWLLAVADPTYFQVSDVRRIDCSKATYAEKTVASLHKDIRDRRILVKGQWRPLNDEEVVAVQDHATSIDLQAKALNRSCLRPR